MDEPTIICPKCNATVKLTESLAAPIIQSARAEYQRQLQAKDADIARRELAVRQQLDAVTRQKELLEEQVQSRLAEERGKLVADEARKARLAIAAELDQKSQELEGTRTLLQQREAKLAEAQKAQAELVRRERELEDQRREMDLTIEKRITESLAGEREKARKQVEEELKLKLADKDQHILGMQKQIEELKKRAEQGSQQLQGEVLELELETTLRQSFQQDSIEPVPKGEFGGDVLHRVLSQSGLQAGTILWEMKRTRTFAEPWLAKLRDDQRAAKADVAVLVTQAMPRSVDRFQLIDGVWVTEPRCAIPVACALRQLLIDVAAARQAGMGQQTKMEMVYAYLTGGRFKRQVEAVIEKFTAMQEDLEKERRLLTKGWAKRQEQITSVIAATFGMYGDLQGIAGKALEELECTEEKLLESDAPTNRGA